MNSVAGPRSASSLSAFLGRIFQNKERRTETPRAAPVHPAYTPHTCGLGRSDRNALAGALVRPSRQGSREPPPMSPRRCSTRDGAPQGEGHTPRIEKSAYVGLRLPERESPLFERGLSRRNEASGAPAHRNSCLGIVSQPFANPRREKNSVGYFFFFLPAFFFILALRLGLDLVAFLRAFRFTGIDTSSCYHCCATSTKTNGWSLCFHPPRPIIETRYCAIKRMASIL